MDKYGYETLKDCLKQRNWADSHDTVMTVGLIMRDEGTFNNDSDIIFEYFDKPWHFEKEMRDLVIEYELSQICDDINRLPPAEALDALDWLDKFGYDSKTIDAIGTDLQEAYY